MVYDVQPHFNPKVPEACGTCSTFLAVRLTEETTLNVNLNKISCEPKTKDVASDVARALRSFVVRLRRSPVFRSQRRAARIARRGVVVVTPNVCIYVYLSNVCWCMCMLAQSNKHV